MPEAARAAVGVLIGLVCVVLPYLLIALDGINERPPGKRLRYAVAGILCAFLFFGVVLIPAAVLARAGRGNALGNLVIFCGVGWIVYALFQAVEKWGKRD